MIHELRVYSVVPGTQTRYLELSETVGRPLRGDRYGRQEGFWFSEVGPMNRLVSLWSFADFEERTRLRALLARDQAWTTDYLPLIRPLLVSQHNRILVPAAPLAVPRGPDHTYELRVHRTHVGSTRKWIEHAATVAPIVTTHLERVGLWETEIGHLQDVVELWAYETGTREESLARLSAEPAWDEFQHATAPLTVESDATLLRPTRFSAMR